MNINRFIQTLSIALIALSLLTGCGPNVTVASNKDVTYHAEPRRIYIIANLGHIFDGGLIAPNTSEDFKSKLVNTLQSCGVASTIESKPPGPVNMDDPRIKNFSPDSILTLSWTSANMLSTVAKAESYLVTLIDVSTKKNVWKFTFNFDRADSVLPDMPKLFTGYIIKQMKTDHLLPITCVVN